jgi:hypothetical protein
MSVLSKLMSVLAICRVRLRYFWTLIRKNESYTWYICLMY